MEEGRSQSEGAESRLLHSGKDCRGLAGPGNGEGRRAGQWRVRERDASLVEHLL